MAADMTLEDVEGHILSVENTIHELKQVLSKVKHARNLLININRLPVELLMNVFICHRDLQFALAKSAPIAEPQWLVPSQVCRHWRAVALSSSVLWNSIDVRFQKLAMILLSRSGNGPLRVCLSPSKRFISWDQSLLAGLAGRRHSELHVRGTYIELDGLINGININHVVSELSSITILCTNISVYRPPPHMFLHTAPSLHELRFNHCRVSLSSPFCIGARGLRSLELKNDRHSLEDIVSAMRHFPVLEELHLHNAISIDLDDAHTPLETAPASECATLVKLRALSVNDGPRAIWLLLRRLRVPDHDGVWDIVVAEAGGSHWGIQVRIARWLFKNDEHLPPDFRALCIERNSQRLLISRYIKSCVTHEEGGYAIHRKVEFHGGSDSDAEIQRYIEPVIPSLSATSTLVLGDLWGMGSVCWDLIGKSRVENVHVRSGISPFITNLLQSGPTFLERMKVLRLDNVTYDLRDRKKELGAELRRRVSEGCLQSLEIRMPTGRWGTYKKELLTWAASVPDVPISFK